MRALMERRASRDYALRSPKLRWLAWPEGVETTPAFSALVLAGKSRAETEISQPINGEAMKLVSIQMTKNVSTAAPAVRRIALPQAAAAPISPSQCVRGIGGTGMLRGA